MRTRTRLATTAGVTVLGFTAMSGIAQADTGLGLSDLTAPLTKTLDGVVKSAVPSTSRSRDSGSSLNIPVHVHVRVPSTPRVSDDGRWRSTEARRTRGSAATADVDATVNASPRAAQVQASVGLCASLGEQCGVEPSPPNPVPPNPPTPPDQPQPPEKTPTASGSAQVGESLPFTGGPIGSLAFLGALSVLTGAAGVAASRLRRES